VPLPARLARDWSSRAVSGQPPALRPSCTGARQHQLPQPAETGSVWALIERTSTWPPNLRGLRSSEPESSAAMRCRACGAGFQAHQASHPTPSPSASGRQPDVRSIQRAGRLAGMRRRALKCEVIESRLPTSDPERFATTIALVRDLQPDRVRLCSSPYLPGNCIASARSPPMTPTSESGAEAAGAYEAFTSDGYIAIAWTICPPGRQPAAAAAKDACTEFPGYTTGGEA